MGDFTTLALDVVGDVATLTLHRPDVRNAMNAAMISELHEAASLLDSLPLRAVVIRGGGKCFCSGVDISEKRTSRDNSPQTNEEASERFVDVFNRLSSLLAPVVAVAHGHSVGGGVGLLACADIVIAASDARFSVSATKIGILPAAMSTVLVRALGVRWAKYIALSGAVFDTGTALTAGLVHILAEPDLLDVSLEKVLELLAEGELSAIRETKRLFDSLEPDVHADSRARRLHHVRSFTASTSAQDRFEQYGREGVFWGRKGNL